MGARCIGSFRQVWGRVSCAGQEEFRCKYRGFLPLLDMLPAHSNSQRCGPDQRSSAFHSSSIQSSALSFVPFFNHVFSTMGKLEGGPGGFKGLDGKKLCHPYMRFLPHIFFLTWYMSDHGSTYKKLGFKLVTYLTVRSCGYNSWMNTWLCVEVVVRKVKRILVLIRKKIE